MDELTKRLWHGVKRGNLTEAMAALEQGAAVDSRDKLNRTPLMEAAKRGHLPVLELLLAKGADINAKDYAGAMPLMSAIAPHQLATVQFLLENGADAALTDKDGEKCFRKIRHQQISAFFSTLFSIGLFLYGQRRSAKDKELQQIEWIRMAFTVYGELVSFQKFQRMAQMIKEAGG